MAKKRTPTWEELQEEKNQPLESDQAFKKRQREKKGGKATESGNEKLDKLSKRLGDIRRKKKKEQNKKKKFVFIPSGLSLINIFPLTSLTSTYPAIRLSFAGVSAINTPGGKSRAPVWADRHI